MSEPLSNKDVQRIISLIFNGLSAAMNAEQDWTHPHKLSLLSTRMRLATATYEALREGDVEIRVKPTAADWRAAARDN